MLFLSIFILGILTFLIIREEVQYIYDLEVKTGLTIFMIIGSAIIIVLFVGCIFFGVLNYFYPDPYYCEYCGSFK